MSLVSRLRGFWDDQRGNVAIISAFSILPLLALAGGATDIARHESYRAQLQDGLDRAVLAAASLTQTRPVEETVRGYLKALPFADDIDLHFTYLNAVNAREVTVTAGYEMQTGFLPLIGIDAIRVGAAATALERRTNIEISLMLDISGSMREGSPSKISLLRPAAQAFIDAILTPETAKFTSVSVVPYAGSVSVGADVFNALHGARVHSNSSCFEFANNEFGVGMLNFTGRAQVPHFTNWNYNTNIAGLNWWWCPTDDTALTFMSNNAAFLKNRIANYKMHDGTGTANAMNWGMMLLEPALRPFIGQAVSANLVPSDFSNRPADFEDPNTVKFIVLMTDGAITEQWRPKDPSRPVTQAPDNQKLFTASVALNQMYAVCNRAKANHVVVYTIGFQVTSEAQEQMRQCATTPNHFYNVAGLDIAGAFRSIASAIQQVRLTQ